MALSHKDWEYVYLIEKKSTNLLLESKEKNNYQLPIVEQIT